jgi:hypothetical protein
LEDEEEEEECTIDLDHCYCCPDYDLVGLGDCDTEEEDRNTEFKSHVGEYWGGLVFGGGE